MHVLWIYAEKTRRLGPLADFLLLVTDAISFEKIMEVIDHQGNGTESS